MAVTAPRQRWANCLPWERTLDIFTILIQVAGDACFFIFPDLHHTFWWMQAFYVRTHPELCRQKCAQTDNSKTGIHVLPTSLNYLTPSQWIVDLYINIFSKKPYGVQAGLWV